MNIYRKDDIPEHLQQYFEPSEIGLESTPEQYVANLVAVFREVKRVLRDDGTLWLNLGDSYASNQSNNGGYSEKSTLAGFSNPKTKGRQAMQSTLPRKLEHGLKPKDLIGIPWRVAFALQADGWYLRQDIIWHKPNPMPESVTDRCTKAHEYIFLLTKSARYWYDNEAIKENTANAPDIRLRSSTFSKVQKIGHAMSSAEYVETVGRNRRSAWTVPTAPYKGAHFAVFPPDLIRPCVQAGCPAGGIVLDPFAGSGTTGQVAIEEGRKTILCELNADYCKLIERRLAGVQFPLMF